MMKMTVVEKFAIALIIVCILGLLAMIPTCIKAKREIEEHGLKSIVNEIWEGKKGK